MTPEQQIKQKVKSMSREELQIAVKKDIHYLATLPGDQLRDLVETIETLKWCEKNI